MMRFYILTAILALVVAVSFGGYRYVSNMQRTIAELTENNAVLEANVATLRGAIAQQEQAIKSYQRDVALKDRIIREVVARYDETREMVRVTEDRLNELNLSSTAFRDPAAAEAIINQRSADINRCLEVASGAELIPEDAMGNSECPALIPRTYEGPQ